ncbi:hypothetical protein [Flavisolibacter ginsenosidimutans]|uniref:Lipoprotein n=1 Tax=Flavisolibacter ginsenosidimutans TaxID=661481 RepID=A0A5B8UHD6_9BACT|nr:hypothetical protein [Flavisolibacter ginsenosidimutans]QEC55539.1 hypothetical protein FSB75_06360 [Flavisolibacter ginsenosidimutans]
MPVSFPKKAFNLLLLFVLLYACKQGPQTAHEQARAHMNEQHPSKPGSSFEDTLTINTKAAVFFEPDSLQLQKIKAVTDKGVFKSSEHEYFYQIRNAHQFLKTNWPRLKIVEARNVRFLLFKKADNTTTLIDLNKQDPSGLFVFDVHQAPLLIDMMNIDTGVPDYFSNKRQMQSKH